MSGHGRNSSVHIEEELAQIRRYEDFTTTGKERSPKTRCIKHWHLFKIGLEMPSLKDTDSPLCKTQTSTTIHGVPGGIWHLSPQNHGLLCCSLVTCDADDRFFNCIDWYFSLHCRCSYWTHVSTDCHCNRLAVRHQAGLLFKCLVAEPEVLLLGNRGWYVNDEHRDDGHQQAILKALACRKRIMQRLDHMERVCAFGAWCIFHQVAVLCDVGSKYLKLQVSAPRVFMVSRLCLPQPVPIWSSDMHPMLLDPVSQRSNVSLVSAITAMECGDSGIDIYTHTHT